MRHSSTVSARRSLMLACLLSAMSTGALAQSVSGNYFSNGADLTTVRPGSQWFSNGASAASTGNNPWFSRGADVANARNGHFADYFTNGAHETHADGAYFSNGAAVTSVPAPGQPGAEYYSNGARATSVPAKGQPGYEYFANGARVTSLPRKLALVPPPEAPAVEPQEPPAQQEEPEAKPEEPQAQEAEQPQAEEQQPAAEQAAPSAEEAPAEPAPAAEEAPAEGTPEADKPEAIDVNSDKEIDESEDAYGPAALARKPPDRGAPSDRAPQIDRRSDFQRLMDLFTRSVSAVVTILAVSVLLIAFGVVRRRIQRAKRA
ncbi:MAG TPA: hypothetical protein VJV78_14250 [Polyangiales bacterium]|nr:hypothetical protein [Polyangiales bacterium]